MPRPSRTPSTASSSQFRTTDYRLAGIALSVPGASLASVTPDPDKPGKPVFVVSGLAEDFQAQLTADAYQVSVLSVLKNLDKCLRLRQTHLGAR